MKMILVFLIFTIVFSAPTEKERLLKSNMALRQALRELKMEKGKELAVGDSCSGYFDNEEVCKLSGCIWTDNPSMPAYQCSERDDCPGYFDNEEMCKYAGCVWMDYPSMPAYQCFKRDDCPGYFDNEEMCKLAGCGWTDNPLNPGLQCYKDPNKDSDDYEEAPVCEDWCKDSANDSSWTSACIDDECKGCAECPQVRSPCEDWCKDASDDEDSSWTLVCRWDECTGCAECDSAHGSA